jgi:hypothetical protein
LERRDVKGVEDSHESGGEFVLGGKKTQLGFLFFGFPTHE